MERLSGSCSEEVDLGVFFLLLWIIPCFLLLLRTEWLARRDSSETYGSCKRTGVRDHRRLKRNLPFSVTQTSDISVSRLQDDNGIYQVHPRRGWTLKLCVTTEPDLGRLNEHVWHGTYSSESPPCSNRLGTWPPPNALIARCFDFILFSHRCHFSTCLPPWWSTTAWTSCA